MKTIKSLALIGITLALSLAACGDNEKLAADAKKPDGPPADAICSNCPAAPTLGTQIDRMGRPAVNTALNNTFSGSPTTAAEIGAAKDNYNAASDKSMWTTMLLTPATASNSRSVEAEFKKNLALLDSLDTKLCGNGVCESSEIGTDGALVCPVAACTTCAADCGTSKIGGTCGDGVCGPGELGTNGGLVCPVTTCVQCAADCGAAGVGSPKGGGGCGNQALYNDTAAGGGTPGPDSYKSLADLLSQDELYVDSSKGVCEYYLAVEFGVVSTSGNTTCGGRAPEYDVIDFSFSMLAMGLKGFTLPPVTPTIQPLFHDGVAAHGDYLSSFPYLGAPH